MLLERFQAFRSGKGFVYSLAIFISGWFAWNFVPWLPHFDRPEHGDPFTLLNLVLSVEAAFAMPVLLMAQAMAQRAESDKLKEVLLATRELLKRMDAIGEDVEEILAEEIGEMS